MGDPYYGPSINPGLLMLIPGVVGLMAIVWLVAIYNRFVNLQNTIKESWSDVDTELRRRYDLIPNLVETVKGYAAHEQSVMQSVTEARTKAVSSTGKPGEQSLDENMLVQSLRQLMAVSEAYPQLKADRSFLQLQRELVNTEDRIQAARRFFNGNIREFNNLVQSFPTNVIASIFGYQTKDYFEIESLDARAPVNIGFSQPH